MNTCGLSRIGMLRKDNQDRYLIRKLPGGDTLLVVADGLGGQEGGALAAQMVVDVFGADPQPTGGVSSQLLSQLQTANRLIIERAETDHEVENMGSTVTAVQVTGNVAHWIQVGDSRLYLFRKNRLLQVTTDQNMAQYLVEEGDITPDEARLSPYRFLLDQYVGFPYLEPVAGHFTVTAGDRLLLCSDGLHDELSETAIAAILARQAPVSLQVEELVDAANQAGGQDNITVIIAEV